MARDTTSGKYYENTVELAIDRSCKQNGLVSSKQMTVGEKPNGGKHKVDWELVSKSDENIRGLLSCKFQEVGGTADEKVPWEVTKLLHTMKTDPRYKKAWIVLGGKGWTKGIREFYKTDLEMYIPEMKSKVFIIIDTDELLSYNFSLL